MKKSEMTLKKISQWGLILLLAVGLICPPTVVWAADETTEAQQEKAVAAAWEAKLGHPLVTEAYWPGKTWYNVKGKAVVYDGNLRRGKAFYDDFIPEYFRILEEMGIRVNISMTYEGGKSQIELKGDTYPKYQSFLNQYASDDHYQLVTWYNDGYQFEGSGFGGNDGLVAPNSNGGFFWGCDGRWYGYMGFAHLLAAKWSSRTFSDDSIPGRIAGYYTNSDDPNDRSVVRLLGILQKCKIPFDQWDYRSRQFATDELRYWAEYAGLNDVLKIPKRDPNRPAHEYGIDGAEVLATGTRSGDYGPYLIGGTRQAWWTALFTEYGKWQKTTKDHFGNYENLPWVLFLYFNDLPRGTEPIFPQDVQGSTTVTPPVTNPPAANSGPDTWAVAEVRPMISAGMIPVSLQRDYQGAISRLEYAQVTAQSLRAKYGLDDAALLSKFGKSALPTGAFSDTDDRDVLLVAALGLVEGTGEGKFSPGATLTREQAATILSRLATLIGKSPTESPVAFSDSSQIASWAAEGVNTVSRITAVDGTKRVMEGSGDRFNPKDSYQRQQCYATLGRLLGLPS